jgi:hypothetical protein
MARSADIMVAHLKIAEVKKLATRTCAQHDIGAAI